jgi:hexosaminidase
MDSKSAASVNTAGQGRWHTHSLLVSLLVALAFPWGTCAAKDVPAMVPVPMSVTRIAGMAVLTPAWRIVIETGSADDSAAVALLVDDIEQAHGLRLKQPPHTHKSTSAYRIVLRAAAGRSPSETELFREQGYELRITPHAITITASSSTGRYYGIQTLRQVVRGVPDGRLPCLVVRDEPALRWRGVSDDLSRGQMSTIADFRAIVEHLSYYKLNMYQLYIEDTFRFPSHPDAAAGPTPLTPGELREIVAEGRRHHVEVVPVLQCLGHQARLLSNPAYRRFAEVQDAGAQPLAWKTIMPRLTEAVQTLFGARRDPVQPWSFSPVLPESRSLVKDLIDDVAQNTEGAFFHVGGGTSRRQVLQAGVGRVLGDYFADLARHLSARHKRRMMVYADAMLAHPEALRALPGNAVIAYWNYRGGDPGADLRLLRAAGAGDILVCSGLWNWDSFQPSLARAFPNIAGMATTARDQRAFGLVVSSWGDRGAESLRQLNWPGYAYAADAGWAQRTDSVEAFTERYATVEYGFAGRRLGYAQVLLGLQTVQGPRSNAWLARMAQLETEAQQALSEINQAEPSVRFSRSSLGPVRYVANRLAFIARRERLLDRLARREAADAYPTSLQEEGDRAALRRLSVESEGLARDYRQLWLESNREHDCGVNLGHMRDEARAIAQLALQPSPPRCDDARREPSKP